MKNVLPTLFHLSISGTINPASDVKRVMSGEFINTVNKWGEMYPFLVADGEPQSRGDPKVPIRFKSFDSLLAMIVYSKNVNSFDDKGETLTEKQRYKEFKNEMKRLEDKYTNYGCYCYITGVDSGVHGGGKPRDLVDTHCKDLYQCYKCLGTDFNATHNDMAEMVYQVKLDGSGNNKDITCQDNFEMTDGCPRNLCECDKRFAQAIAKLDDQCQSNNEPCQTDKWYTSTATQSPFHPVTNPGKFDPTNLANCDAKTTGEHHDKGYCCGVYPDRYPYNPKARDCCELTEIDAFLDAVNIKEDLVPSGTCIDRGGRFIDPDHKVHNHAHDTVMGSDSLVLGRTLNDLHRRRTLRNRRRTRR